METTTSGNMSIAIDLLSGKWQLKILICLCQAKTIRFNDLKRMLPGISNNMLSQCLKQFEKYKIVERKQYEEIPPRVEYSLTEIGKKFHTVIAAMETFGNEYIAQMNGGEKQ